VTPVFMFCFMSSIVPSAAPFMAEKKSLKILITIEMHFYRPSEQ